MKQKIFIHFKTMTKEYRESYLHDLPEYVTFFLNQALSFKHWIIHENKHIRNIEQFRLRMSRLVESFAVSIMTAMDENCLVTRPGNTPHSNFMKTS